MRNIKDYEKKYMEEPFEETMADIRRRCVVEQIGGADLSGKNILEVGCGTHPLFFDLNDFSKMVIVEPSTDFCRIAEDFWIQKYPEKEIKIIQGFFEEKVDAINELNIDFDVIVVSSLLHELERPQEFLFALRKVCSAKSLVHINVPNAKSMHRLIAYECGMIPSVFERSEQQIKMQRFGVYDMDSLVEEVSRAGFMVESRGSYFIKPLTHSQMQKCLDKGIISEQVLEGLEKITKYFSEYGAEIYVNVKRDGYE